MSYTPRLLKSECRSIAILASIFSLRMLGLFMILPVFAVYARELSGSTPVRIGLALGLYGLIQALLQAPFGYISDRLGRRPVIILGLLLFTLGSVVAAMSDSMTGVIVGRSLQGAGAVGSVIMALLSDLTREEVRLKAMAMMGISIGGSFAVAFVLGPLCAAWIGVSGIFWLIAGLSFCSIFILYWGLPSSNIRNRSNTPSNTNNSKNINNTKHPTSNQKHENYNKNSKKSANCNQSEACALNLAFALNPQTSNTFPKITSFPYAEILPTYFGVFVIHACLTALFLKLPLALNTFMPQTDQAFQFYLPVFLASAITTFVCLSRLDKTKTQQYYLALLPVLAVLLLSFLWMHFFWETYLGLAWGLYLFFTAFNLLEASLPSHISKKVPIQHRGVALGVFSSLQFLGLSCGGILGGWLDAQFGSLAVLLFCVILTLIWSVWILMLNFKLIKLRGFIWHEA